MSEPSTRPYFAFLLRLWREPGETAWRITLQDARTNEQHGFRSLSEFTRFLHDHIEEEPPPKSREKW